MNWISTGVSPENIKPFHSSFATIMPNLGNGRIILKLSNSVLMQKNSSLLYGNSILNLYIVFEFNWLRNPSNEFTIKNYLFWHSEINKTCNQK